MSIKPHAQIDAARALIARNFDSELKDQRWSKRAAATALGLTHTYVTSRANGSVEMSGSDLALFASFLHVPVGSFFEDNKKGPASEETEPDALWAPSGSNRRPKDYQGDGTDDDTSPHPVADLDFERERRRSIMVEVSA